MLAALINVASNLGLPVMAALVGGEALGIPLPGETALITAGVLAGKGRLDIVAVIVVAAVAAIIGDNIGYVIGRTGGRRLLLAPGPLARHRRAALERAEPFFERHGAKAVFFGRWVAALRVVAAWMAGITHLRWPVFLLWNALGGIVWAVTVGLVAYYAGPAVVHALSVVGIGGLIAVAVLVAAYVGWRWARARRGR